MAAGAAPRHHSHPPTGPHLPTGPDPSTGELVSRLSGEISHLVRGELELARAEVTDKAKQTGIGASMFGVAGVLSLYGAGVLIAAAILALTLALDPWLAALIVGVALLLVAGVAALLGRRRLGRAGPPVPTRAVAGVREDIETLRHGSDHHSDFPGSPS